MDANKASAVRRGIIGHSHVAFAESFPWKSDQLPHLADFAELIVDARTLTAADALVTSEDMGKVRNGLYRQLTAGGHTVVVFRRPQEILGLPLSRKEPRQFKQPVMHTLGISGDFMEESGKSLTVHDVNAFRSYLASLRQYDFHFAASLGLGTPDGRVVPIAFEPIVGNLEKRLVAGRSRIGQGALTILPDVPSTPISRSLELIFEGLSGLQVRATAPAWIGEIEIHGVDSLRHEIQVHEGQIQLHQASIDGLEAQKAELLGLAGLLYLDGKELETIVQRVLTTLGGTVIPAKYAEEEYVLEFESRHYVVEVKGSTSSANKSMVGQTIEHRMAAETKSDSDVGALLVVNAWRTTPPRERGRPDRMEIPDNVQRRATEYGLPIVTGRQLLLAVNLVMNGRRKGPDMLRDILASRGLVQLDYLADLQR